MANLQRGFVYAVFFSGGLLKVGMSKCNPESRVYSAISTARKNGHAQIAQWISPQVEDKFEAERKLLHAVACAGGEETTIGSEWFSSISAKNFEYLTNLKFETCHESVPKLGSPLKNRAIRMSDSEWKTFKLLLGMDWLRKQIEKAEKKAKKPENAAQ